MDEDHLVFDQFFHCRNQNSRRVAKRALRLTVLDTNGQSKSLALEFKYGITSGPIVGPSGTILLVQERNVIAFDNQLRVQQKLPCPGDDGRCWIYGAPSKSTGSDFAVCSTLELSENCYFYRGLPSEQSSAVKLEKAEERRLPADPYKEALPVAIRRKAAFEVTPTEFWYFGGGELWRIDSSEAINPVTADKWESGATYCGGSLSRSEPLRLVAICSGARVYTDGELDALFGFSRIALFDVSTRKIIAEINGRTSTPVALSPSGKLVAVQHKKKIRLYRVE